MISFLGFVQERSNVAFSGPCCAALNCGADVVGLNARFVLPIMITVLSVLGAAGGMPISAWPHSCKALLLGSRCQHAVVVDEMQQTVKDYMGQLRDLMGMATQSQLTTLVVRASCA